MRNSIFKVLNRTTQGEISSLDLIILALSHLRAKKSRTAVTIFGMAIGFGAVIFLLSVGYGTEKLVVSRVARLDEMFQTNVTVGQTSSLVINDDSITAIESIEGVTAVMPLLSVVSKVDFNNSVSDVVAYGVSKEFLKASAIRPVHGEIFENGEILTSDLSVSEGEVAGARIERVLNAKLGKQISQIKYSIFPLVWKPVYAGPSEDSELLGYTNRLVGNQEASEVWGNQYRATESLLEGIDIYDNLYSPWIADSFLLWEKTDCNSTTETDCTANQYRILKTGTSQSMKDGFISERDIVVERFQIMSESAPRLLEGESIADIQFKIPLTSWAQIYSEPSQVGQLLDFYSSQISSETPYSGELVFGEGYYSADGWGNATDDDSKKLGYWIRAKVPQWRKIACEDCGDKYIREVDHLGVQVMTVVYLRADQLEFLDLTEPPQFGGQVLGVTTEEEATDSASQVALNLFGSSEEDGSSESAVLGTEFVTASGLAVQQLVGENGELEWVTIASDSATGSSLDRAKLTFSETALKQAIVNTAMLKLLNISENEAVGRTFNAVFRFDEEFFEESGFQAESESTTFTIVGVYPDERTPAFYLPFSDLKNLGIDNYTQLKVVVSEQYQLRDIRSRIESLGFKTSSVVDTVDRINGLFSTARILLSVLGFVALSVAALGMFNTLTVSLLEKTREVGLMKVIGMKSNEVKRLFLAESIIMGLSGGIFGLFLSLVAGKLLSFSISMISVSKGLGYIDLVYVPLGLGIGVIILSFMIGVFTGIYPSNRATKISALNALRYE